MNKNYTKITLQVVIFYCFFLICNLLQAQVVLTGTNYTQTFDGIGSGLPVGWTVRTGSNATSLGTAATLVTAHTSWVSSTGNFRNCASNDGTDASTNTDRSLAIRQTGSFGDGGGAFLAQISNTTGFENLQLSFKLQSLDAGSPRTTTWLVQWATGAAPTSFNTLTTIPATTTTGGTASSNVTVTATLPASVDNQANNLWIRIVALSASTGSGNRPTSGIDDFSLTYSETANSSPRITATGSLSNFTAIENTPSATQNYSISGINLTDNITVTPPAGYEISLASASGFVQNPATVILNQNSGIVASTPIYVRLIGSPAGTFNGNITHTSTGASTINLPLSGSVNPNLNNPTPIGTARTLTQGTTVTIAGRVTVAQQFGGLQIFVQDATGGISVFKGTGNLVQENGLVLGDSVQVQGILGNFNQLLQINLTQINKVATTPTIPAPKLILSTQMLANEGQLVRINDLNLLGILSIAGQTNYAFLPIQVRITNATNSVGYANPLVGTSLVAGTGYAIGIAGRFNTSAQLLPRLVADIVRTGDPAPGSTDNTFANDATLDVACWNVEWFGSTGFGPTNEALQNTNAKTVIKTLNADIYNLNEISSLTAFNTLVSELNTEGFAYSGVCSSRLSNNDNVGGQRVCFLYKTALFSNITTKHIFETLDDSLDANKTVNLLQFYPDADKTRFWASGRLPFTLTADVNIPNSPAKRIMFVGIHARANTSTDPSDALSRYNMRKFDVEALKDTLDARFPTQPFILMGDYNDDVDFTVATAANVPNNQSSFVAYTNDPTRYNIHTRALSDAGLKSTVGFSDMIDHLSSSNELTTEYISNSARVGTPESYVASYGTTTSDHYPVMARFNLNGNCIADKIITADINASGLTKIEAGNSITATNKITNGANVVYDAQKFVILNPGFEINAAGNTVFKTQLDGCGGQ